MTGGSAENAQWSVEAEDGARSYTSQDVAEAVAAGATNYYFLGLTRSPVVRAYGRPNDRAEWSPLPVPPASTPEEGQR